MSSIEPTPRTLQGRVDLRGTLELPNGGLVLAGGEQNLPQNDTRDGVARIGPDGILEERPSGRRVTPMVRQLAFRREDLGLLG